jgi:hypothetical protein
MVDFQKYIGKYVTYEYPDGKVTGGIVDSFGPNKLIPEFGIQIVLDRCPITNINPNKVKIRSLPISWYGSDKKNIDVS